MYCISDKQIDFILNDIRARGIEMEGLQQDILDHVCCVIEQNLEENGDFESFYSSTIKTFYKRELREIEEETITLLTFKNYYIMKKAMIISGIFSVSAFILGSIFKLAHWPGAGPLLVLGIGTLSLIFLPLMFILKTKDNSNKRDKLVVAIGSLVGILLCLAVLFKIMHWPGGNGVLWFSAIGISFFVLIPLYFFTGIRNPETKVNTIVTTIVLIGASGLLFAMMNVRPSKNQIKIKMHNYVLAEELLQKMQAKSDISGNNLLNEININCEQIKKLIIMNALGDSFIPKDFDNKNVLMEERNLGDDFYEEGKGYKLFKELKEKVNQLNASANGKDENKIPVDHSVLKFEAEEIGMYNNYAVLSGITQLQMYLANVK